jgi:hypothetical protein
MSGRKSWCFLLATDDDPVTVAVAVAVALPVDVDERVEPVRLLP